MAHPALLVRDVDRGADQLIERRDRLRRLVREVQIIALPARRYRWLRAHLSALSKLEIYAPLLLAMELKFLPPAHRPLPLPRYCRPRLPPE